MSSHGQQRKRTQEVDQLSRTGMPVGVEAGKLLAAATLWQFRLDHRPNPEVDSGSLFLPFSRFCHLSFSFP